MEKEIKITVPEGYDDAVFDPETKTVKFIKKPKELVKTWIAYCKKHDYGHYSQPWIARPDDPYYKGCALRDDFVCHAALESMAPTDKAKMETLAKLIMLRKDWVGDWEPDGNVTYSAIGYSFKEGIEIIPGYMTYNRALSFPDAEMAMKFAATFESMLENVKEFI